MSNDKATAILALDAANKALARARTAFKRMGDHESAELMRESIDDNSEVLRALVRNEPRPALGVVS